jgi:hypothetical protein
MKVAISVRGDLAGTIEVPIPNPPDLGFSHVETPAIGGERNAVRAVEREDHFSDVGPVGLGVVHARAIARALSANTVIGEPEAAALVEDEIVGTAQWILSALRYSVVTEPVPRSTRSIPPRE